MKPSTGGIPTERNSIEQNNTSGEWTIAVVKVDFDSPTAAVSKTEISRMKIRNFPPCGLIQFIQCSEINFL